MRPKVQDISIQTQQLVDGPVTAWQHRSGRLGWLWQLFGLGSQREFIAASSRANELILFRRKSPANNWTALNITQLVNHQIASRPCAWSGKKGWWFWGQRQEHIACVNGNGDLVHIVGKGNNWSATNISVPTGYTVDGALTRWYQGGKNHLAGIGPGNQLLVFTQTSGGWQVNNISQPSGISVTGPVSSWLTPNGLERIAHIAAINTASELIVFWQSSDGSWKNVNVSTITQRQVNGGLDNWQTWNGPYLVEHIAARGDQDEVLVFWWSPQHDWQVVDVSRINLEHMAGPPRVYQRRDDDGQNAEVIAFRGPNETLWLHWWKPSSDWVALNLSAATNEVVRNDPDSWTSYSKRYRRKIEYVAAQGDEFKLLLFSYDHQPRSWVESLVAPYESLQRLRGIVRDVLVILWDWNDPSHARPDPALLDAIIFGPSNSANDYFRENSNGHFALNRVDMLGWYDAEIGDHTYYQNANDAGDSNQDGFINQHHVKYKEAIELAHASGFPFANYDANQDGQLSLQELPILLIVPGSGGRGFWRSINAVEHPSAVRLNINGLEFDSLVEIYTPPIPTVGIYAHELGHILLGLGDMYWESLPGNSFMRYAPGAYAIMDRHGRSPHLDPFAKMKLGWASPRLVLHSGWYDFPSIEHHHKVWVLMDPNRGTDEYFLIENRYPAGTYEQSLPDQGLAVWHIVEDHQVYNALPCPVGMDANVWTQTQTGRQWSRLGIRMIRPIITQFDDQRALWDGADPQTGYDLLSTGLTPNHAELQWADGSPSGFEIRSISAAGNVMQAYIEVPF